MKRMKKMALIAGLLFGAAVFSTVCSAQEAEAKPIPLKTGLLAFDISKEAEREQLIADHIAAHRGDEFEFSLTYYDNMTSLLMALQARDIYVLITGESAAQYMVAQNDTLMVAPQKEGDGISENMVSYMMVMKEEDTELQELFNHTIRELKEDGTIDKLIESGIQAHIDASEPQTSELPVIEGAETVKGDLPPMDYAAVDGTPAGFNVELLAEISKKANINIEIITVDSSARIAALTSGRADVLFWISSNTCSEHEGFEGGSVIPEGLITTEPYFEEGVAFVTFKQY